MSDFFDLRLRKHQKRMMKYMRYVLNDHFVLVCLFLVGGLGFYYSNVLQTLPENFRWGLPIVLLLWWLVLPAGTLVTLLEPADTAFILPKEGQMKGYLKKALNYSLLFPFVLLILVIGAAMPLIVVVSEYSFSSMIWFVVMLWGLKYSQLLILRFSCYQQTEKRAIQLKSLWYIASLLVIAFSLYLFPIVGAGIALALVALFHRLSANKKGLLDWEKMVRRERSRLYRIYQFINLFTDVPEIESKVKRRKYLDQLLKQISFKQENTYLYLFVRRALRGTEYSGLYLRLLAIGGILIATLQDVRFAIGISVLLIYLIGFQLIPLYGQFDYISFVQLYPVSKKTKQQSLQKLLIALLLAAACVFTLVSLTQLPVTQSLFLLVILLVEVALFIGFYLPNRIKKWRDKG
ncbi:ABC transporter [Enterococcus florum]|uniref:ABC transporter n=1 Tax=Enterococcus florum TaxID=2480627 RepID=A0A4P5PPP3_9ENTE|nr:ABC transporter permease [Enterococcus florum]GCF95053.1 ABC transporter [Enterococcus florum]